MTTQTILIKGKLTPKQIDTLTGAVKWIERICDRKEMLPASFMDNTDPTPLAKELRKMIRENTTCPSVSASNTPNPKPVDHG